jgi:hypothetical protein
MELVMKITKRQLRRLIREELETLSYEEQTIDTAEAESAALERDRAEDIDTVEDAWAGGPNLVQSMDHADAVDSDPVTRGQEIMKVVERARKRARVMREQWGDRAETGNPLIEFAKAYSGLGNAIQEQVDSVVAAYINGGGPNSSQFESVVYEQNPNAIDRALESLMYVARDAGSDGEEIINALNEAQNMLSR